MQRRSIPLLVFLFCSSAGAATYFVSPDGDDGKDGMALTSAWQSLTKVGSFSTSPGFRPGDRILFQAGQAFEHRGSLQFASSGEPDSPIVLSRYGTGTKPVLRTGLKILEGWEPQAGGVFRWRQTTSDASGFWEDDVFLPRASSAACTDGAWFHEAASGALFYRPTSGSPETHGVRTTHNGGSGLSFTDQSHIRVSGLRFPGMHSPLIFRARQGPIRGITVEDCEFEWTQVAIDIHYPGLRVEDVVLRRNTITHYVFATKFWCDGMQPVLGRMSRVLIEDNLLTDLDTSGRMDPARKSDHEAIYIQCPENLIIRGNTVRDVAPGTNGQGSGISIWVADDQTGYDNVLVEGNLLLRTDCGISAFGGSTPDRAKSVFIHDNIIAGCRTGMRLNTRTTSPGSLLAHHNTIHACETGIRLEYPTGWELAQNLLSHCSVNVACKTVLKTGEIYPIHDNLYFHSTGPLQWMPSPSAPCDRTAWRQLRDVSGDRLDTGSLFADPRLAHPAGPWTRREDLLPLKGSPALRSGKEGIGARMLTPTGAPSRSPGPAH